MVLNPGTVLSGRYEIIEKIGSGGMAVVYRGKDKKLDRYVTIKVLREEFNGDEEFIDRFRSEARAAAKLSHPNIVRAYDVGDDGDINYIVMEYIHGDTLKKAIKEKAPFDSRSTINVAIQIASALAQAHKAHIVHRDIKPQNILVGTDGVVKVTDFGIARAATASTMTTTANAAGSVHYFSPEQARGGYVDEKSDIYSLGVTMFEMITGVLPFQGNNSVTIALKHINDELPDIRKYNPNCTPSLEGIIKKATMKKADERYSGIDQLLADLIRARAEITGAAQNAPLQAQSSANAQAQQDMSDSGLRMSRRAAAAAQLKAAQEKAAAEKAAQEAETAGAETTKPADRPELEQIRHRRAAELHTPAEQTEAAEPAEAEEKAAGGSVREPLVSFEKYGKKLRLSQISKEDDYEKEYVEAEPVKTSRRPEKVRRNPRAEEGYDNEHDRRAERKVIIAAVITALILIGIISAVGLRFMGGGFVSSEKTIETPQFIGVLYEDAVKAAEELGIVLVEDGEDYSSYFDVGEIFYQSVTEGTMVGEGTKIGVKVSLGLTSEEMPNVAGDEENDAVEKIVRLVGDVVQIEYRFDPEVEAGTVIEQQPEAGTEITAKSNIRLIISKGDENGSVSVPNVVNATEAEARNDLEAVGLVVGTVSYAESDRVAEGRVITQTLAANQEVASGSVVNLVVSTGSAAAETPEETTPSENTNNNTNTNTNANTNAEGTKYFTIQAPAGSSGSVYVRVVKNDADGVYPVVDEYRDVSEFPYSISVTGKGSGTVTCYIDDVQQWSQSVNFAE